MARRVFDFEWLVHEGGYEWNLDPATGRRVIRPRPIVLPDDNANVPVRRYRPLNPNHPKDTALFQALARTEPTEDGIVGFSARYGLLTSAFFPMASEKGVRPRILVPWTDGEPYRLWRSEIAAVRRAVKVWLWVRNQDIAALKRHIVWRGSPGKRTVSFTRPVSPSKRTRPCKPGSRREAGELIAYETDAPRDVQLFNPKDVITPAKFYLKGLVEHRLNGRTGCGHPSGGMGADMAWDAESGVPYLRFRPNSLLVGIWAQFGRALSGDVEYIECGACQKLCEVSSDGSRASRRFCSDPCRFKLFRGRQRRARELHAEGKAVEAIAAELDTDAETVKGWVQVKRSKR